MTRQSAGEMRMELAEHKRDEQRLRDSITDVCYGCVAGGDNTRHVPEDVDHHSAGKHSCAYHWPDEAGEFPDTSE